MHFTHDTNCSVYYNHASNNRTYLDRLIFSTFHRLWALHKSLYKIRYRKNIVGNICKLYIVAMREIRLGRLTVNLTHFTDTFFPRLTDYINYIYI